VDVGQRHQHHRHHRIVATSTTIGLHAFGDLLSSPAAAADLTAPAGTPVVVVDLTEPVGSLDLDLLKEATRALPTVLVGIGPVPPPSVPVAAVFDVVLEDPKPVLDTVERYPLAAVTAAVLLRSTLELDVASALAAESAAYSVLQAGPEFARWLASRPATKEAPQALTPAVVVSREDDTLSLTLNRPAKHNAFNMAMRDELSEALFIALSDPSITQVVLTGAGPSFCSGGDLDEFGTLPDPATAHLTRLARSVGRLIALIGPRMEVRLHGACLGAGIELAAFAGRVVSHVDAVIALPEMDLGLIPGAGGTVSLPRRIGRQRTAELLLTRTRLDARTAHAWGLIDELEQLPETPGTSGP
jgi:enoyl-CoA hydratase/carnithine racemase